MERNKILDQTASQKTYLEEICQRLRSNLAWGRRQASSAKEIIIRGSRVIETLSKITALKTQIMELKSSVVLPKERYQDSKQYKIVI